MFFPRLIALFTRDRPHFMFCDSFRLQLMCYKYLWDTLAVNGFFAEQFFNFFALNRYNILSKEIREETAKSGFSAKVSMLFFLFNLFTSVYNSHVGNAF